MTTEVKETVGQAALRLMEKGDQNQSVIDTQREMQKNYIDNLIQAAKDGENRYGKDKPFYICVQNRRERTMTNVIRSQFYTRQTRPSPAYDLSLYWYNPKDENLRFVWCIPDKETVNKLIENELSLPDDHKELIGFCKAFVRGVLV